MAQGEADADVLHGGFHLGGAHVAAVAGEVAVVGEGVDDGAGPAEVGGGGGAVFACLEDEGGGFVGFGGRHFFWVVGVLMGGQYFPFFLFFLLFFFCFLSLTGLTGDVKKGATHTYLATKFGRVVVGGGGKLAKKKCLRWEDAIVISTCAYAHLFF